MNPAQCHAKGERAGGEGVWRREHNVFKLLLKLLIVELDMVEGSHLNTTGAPVVYTTIHVIDIPNNWPRNVNQSQPVRSVPGNC